MGILVPASCSVPFIGMARELSLLGVNQGINGLFCPYGELTCERGSVIKKGI